MKTTFMIALTAVTLGLSACAIHVRDNGEDQRLETCSVHCGAGSQARVSCAKPAIPACSCEPDVAAACITAHRPRLNASL